MVRKLLAQLQLVNRSLVHDCLAELRDSRTSPERFRVCPIASVILLGAGHCAMCRPSMAPWRRRSGPSPTRRLATDIVMAPVLRGSWDIAGDAGARAEHAAISSSVTNARRLRRSITLLPKNIRTTYVLLIDPMLATGGSAVAALDMLTKAGARHLRLVCIVAAPEGVKAVETAYPSVPIFTPVVDRELNAHKFIVPGLGDFGDRLFGTV
jgi:uracil phosphoribosyltransferase